MLGETCKDLLPQKFVLYQMYFLPEEKQNSRSEKLIIIRGKIK